MTENQNMSILKRTDYQTERQTVSDQKRDKRAGRQTERQTHGPDETNISGSTVGERITKIMLFLNSCGYHCKNYQVQSYYILQLYQNIYFVMF